MIPASSPNGFGSPSYPAWRSNAIYAIQNGLHSYGTPGTPSFYERARNSIYSNENLVTSFPSWMGSASPAADFGAGYGAELGNRMLFGIHILGNGQKFSISKLSFVMHSTDPDNSLGFTFPTGGYNYSPDYVGIDYGIDGVRGTGDDVTIMGGPNTQLVDELVGRGSGNAWWPMVTDPGATLQEKMDNVAASLPNMHFHGNYTLLDGSGNVLATGGNRVHIKKFHGN